MSEGKIFVAKENGVYLLKLVGDVRLNLCTALDIFLERMIDEPALVAVLIDLSEAEAVDSTTLGFLAKISILTQKLHGWLPTIICDNGDITRILLSMGFDQVFHLIDEKVETPECVSALSALQSTESEVKEKVLEAHRILMDLNESNREKFRELVEMLESEG